MPGDGRSRRNRRRPKHFINDLEERLASISATMEAERHRNTNARIESALLETLLVSRMVLMHLLAGDAAASDAACPWDAVSCDVPALETVVAPTGSVSPVAGTAAAAAAAVQGAGSSSAAADAGANGGPRHDPAASGMVALNAHVRPPLPLLARRLQQKLDELITTLHGGGEGPAGVPFPPPPLLHRPRASNLLAGIMAVRGQHFSSAQELYSWWLQQMGEACTTLAAVGTAVRRQAVSIPGGNQQRGHRAAGVSSGRGGGGGGDGDGSGTPEARLVEILHTAVPRLWGHFLFHPWSVELLTSNMETRQPGGAAEDLWAAWLKVMGITEQQEAVLLRLHHIFESHMAMLRSEQRHLLAILTSHPDALDVTERSDTLDALASVNSWLAICAVSTSLVLHAALLTPRQALEMHTAAAPQWVAGVTGFLDAVARREVLRQQPRPLR